MDSDYISKSFVFHVTGKKRPCFSALLQLKKKLRQEKHLKNFLKCFVRPDISSEWSCTEASCTECQNMPAVLDLMDVWTHWAVFFLLVAHYCISNVRDISLKNQLFSQLDMTLGRQLYWKIIAKYLFFDKLFWQPLKHKYCLRGNKKSSDLPFPKCYFHWNTFRARICCIATQAFCILLHCVPMCCYGSERLECLAFSVKPVNAPSPSGEGYIFFSEEISRGGWGAAGNSAKPDYAILSHAP